MQECKISQNEVIKEEIVDKRVNCDEKIVTKVEDVYKRQTTGPISTKLGTNILRNGRTNIWPVSYTHLDVYKRQFVNFITVNLNWAV